MARRKKRALKKIKVETALVTCAYCEGSGKDPFGIPSELSTCQVCGGRGKVSVMKPTRECVFCGGTGIFPDRRLTCTVCMGKGLVTVKPGAKACPDCEGTGVAKNTPGLPCATCHGKGVI